LSSLETMVLLLIKRLSSYISVYIQALRHVAYYQNIGRTKNLSYLYWYYKYRNLGIKLGFSIGVNSIGYGVVIPHYGTIVVNPYCRIGNYAVLHTSTCVGGADKIIGDNFYLGTGSQVMKPLRLGNNVQVAAHSLCNKSFGDGVLLVGAPAHIAKEGLKPWYIEQNSYYAERVKKIEKLRKEYYSD